MRISDPLPDHPEPLPPVENVALAADITDESGPLLQLLAAQVRREYVAASPWPHAVVTGMFSEELIDRAAQEGRDLDAALLFRTEGRNQIKEEISGGLGPVCSGLLAQMHEPAFIEFVSAVTGIPDLVADPTHEWAGLHRTPRGGFAMVHRDFRAHSKTGLHHRVNVLLYLNRAWPLEYGGALELWPPDMRAVAKVIQPVANTLVIFETHDQTLHGFPDPVACPAGDARLSLACYFYTSAARPQKVPLRRPIWARRPQDGFLVGRRGPASVLGDFAPAALRPAARRLLEAFRSATGTTRKPRGQ
jgi:hypothetical protein